MSETTVIATSELAQLRQALGAALENNARLRATLEQIAEPLDKSTAVGDPWAVPRGQAPDLAV
jgi:hypothetical protein